MNLNKRFKSILETKHLSDCTFIIEGEKIKAHKLILSCSSPVFEKMFYGGMATNEVQITDISLDNFNQILQYIYTDSVTFKSLINAWSLYTGAHRFLLNDLLSVCLNYIEGNLTIGNLVLSYEYADMFGIECIKNQCLYDISCYTRGIFCEEFYYHMKPSTLSAILLENKLNIDHTNLCKGILYWGCIECDNRNIEKLPENILKILNDSNLLHYLLNLKAESFPRSNENHQEIEQLIIKSYELLNEKYSRNPPTINIKKNTEVPLTSFCKFRSIYKISSRVPLSQTNEFQVVLKVNIKIILFGLIVSRDDSTSCDNNQYVENIFIKINGLKNPSNSEWSMSYQNSNIKSASCYVPLEEPIVFEPGELYKISVTFWVDDEILFKKSSVLYYFMNQMIDDKEKGVLFNFFEFFGGIIQGLSYYPA